MSLLVIDGHAGEPRARRTAPTGHDLDHALGQIHLGSGAYDDAVPVLARTCRATDASVVALADLAEAALRSGARAVAEDAACRLFGALDHRSDPMVLGVLARVRALLAADVVAEALYLESLDWLVRTDDDAMVARTHLVYGEWLRRRHRRREARRHLRRALELFELRPPATFGKRTRDELLAASETARVRTVDTATDLTPRERQVVDEVAQGRTNREIAERLHLSPATVDFHLRKVFVKLGIQSRRQLFGAGREVSYDIARGRATEPSTGARTKRGGGFEAPEPSATVMAEAVVRGDGPSRRNR